MNQLTGYPYEVRPLADEDGGGFAMTFPDFTDCISDGETVQDAIRSGHDALQATLAALKARHLPIPTPRSLTPDR